MAYDQVFGRRPKPGPARVPLDDLFTRQEEVHASVLAKAFRTSDGDRLLLWKALRKEVAQGFGAVHLGRLPPTDVDAVFYPRFIAEPDKWNVDTWLRKSRPVDNATSNGGNDAL